MSALAIVAIPAEDDRVWKVSSEKVPHLTLLYLGEGELRNEENVVQFIKHVADTSLRRFGMSVDRRGELGDEDADVLFFEKSFSYKSLLSVRAHLLTNPNISEMYNSAEQYEGWTPHLTLGYPESPAHDDAVDYPINWVRFDKIALWTGDYEGPEFLLKQDEGMMLDSYHSDISELAEDVLAHYGVQGMKWGVRRAGKTGGTSAMLARARQLDKPWEDRIKADPKVKKVARVAQRNAKLQIRALRKDYKASGVNINRYRSTRAQYDARVQKIIEETFRDAAFEVHGNSPSRLQQVELQRNSDGTMTAKFSPRTNSKIAKQLSSVAKVDQKLAEQVVKHAAEDLVDLSDLELVLSLDDKGFATDILVPGLLDDAEHSDMSYEDSLAHFGVKGMKWGVRRKVGSDGRVEGPPPKSGPHSPAGGKSSSTSSDHDRVVENLKKSVEHLSTAEIREITNRIEAINKFNKAAEAQRQAQQSKGKKLAKWAAKSVATGVKRGAEQYLEATGADFAKKYLQEATGTRKKSRKSKGFNPNPRNPDPTPSKKKTPSKDLVYNITTKGG